MTRSSGSVTSSTRSPLPPLLANPETRRAIRAELGPLFANEQQRAFYDSRAPELLYSGAFGAGKSRILCEKAYWLGKRYPGASIGIFRKVAASLAATTRLTFTRDVLPSGAIARSNKTEGWMELANGSRFWFLGLDPDPVTGVPSKVGSLDLTFGYVDEAVELSEGDWVMLEGRLRKTEAVDWHGEEPWTQLGAATNPADPLHWLNVRFAADHPGRTRLHARTFDNRLLPRAYLDRMGEMGAGIFRSRYVEGEWVSISGDVFRADWFHPVMRHPPELVRRVGVDLAASTKTSADYTAVVEVGQDREHNLYVLGAWRERINHGHRDWLLTGPPHLQNGRSFTAVNVEAVAFQSTFFHELINSTNLPARAIHPDKDKLTRALALQTRYAAGKVHHLIGAPGIAELEAELLAFPGGTHDDLVDALVYAADVGNQYTGSLVGSN